MAMVMKVCQAQVVPSKSKESNAQRGGKTCNNKKAVASVTCFRVTERAKKSQVSSMSTSEKFGIG